MISYKQCRMILLYEFKLGHTAGEALRNIKKAFGDGVMEIRTVQRWFHKFRSGDENLDNEPRGRPKSIINHEQLNDLIKQNPKATVRKLSEELHASRSTISRHLKAIKRTKVRKQDRGDKSPKKKKMENKQNKPENVPVDPCAHMIDPVLIKPPEKMWQNNLMAPPVQYAPVNTIPSYHVPDTSTATLDLSSRAPTFVNSYHNISQMRFPWGGSGGDPGLQPPPTAPINCPVSSMAN